MRTAETNLCPTQVRKSPLSWITAIAVIDPGSRGLGC